MFHRRLFEQDLSDEAVQTYFVSLDPAIKPSATLTKSLEARADLRVHTVVSGDLMMHSTRIHADEMRTQPEVRAVVPLLPELKVTPHFDRILPAAPSAANASAADRHPTSLNVRLIPLEEHEHLRPSASALASRFQKAIAGACASGKNEWRGRVACSQLGGAQVRVESVRTLVVDRVPRADALLLASLIAAQPETLWVEPHAEYRALNQFGVAITQDGANGQGQPLGYPGNLPLSIHAMGLHGEDEIIGVGDSGLDTGHCFFEDTVGGTADNQDYGPSHRKVVAYRGYADNEATGLRDHGTHVVGSILGQSIQDGVAGKSDQGSAYAAKVSFTDIGPGNAPGLAVPNDLVNNFFNVDYDNGARIHSNSWGANINAYTIPTADVDEFMHTFTDMLILYAAGNSGDEGPKSIGAPATCKNCLTVGASENFMDPPQACSRTPPRNCADGHVALFSSQGPSLGSNMVKPDVVAPGFYIMSAGSNTGEGCGAPQIIDMAGTSMATPITAGDVALIRQYYREGWYPQGVKGKGPHLPTGALLKATVIHSGVALTGTYQGTSLSNNQRVLNHEQGKFTPSFVQGFGRVQLNRVLFSASAGSPAPSKRMFVADDADNALADGEEHSYALKLSGTPDAVLGTELKATLVWTDPPAQPNSRQPLINNLDLVVELNGQTLRGNGEQAGDTANTVEQVLTQATAGDVTIKVVGTGVQEGTQTYALVVSGPFDHGPESGNPDYPKGEKRKPDGSVEEFEPGLPGDGNGNLPPAMGGLGSNGGSDDSSGDAVALGITIPLLIIAIGAGFCFLTRKQANGPDSAGGISMLPPGFRQLKDPVSGAPYYLNERTGSTRWEPPPPLPPTAPPPGDEATALPANWSAVLDPSTNREYYYNSATGATQWTAPTS